MNDLTVEQLVRLECLNRALKLRCDDESDVSVVIAAAQKFYDFVIGDAAVRSTVTIDANGNITGFSPVVRPDSAQASAEGPRF